MRSKVLVYLCAAAVIGAFTGSALAQQFVYSKNNQTPEQQKKDEFDSHTWAVQQSGYNPTAASQTPPTTIPTDKPTAEAGSGVRCAAKGAAAVAAIGAAAGGVGGRARSRNKAEEKQEQQAAQANAAASQTAALADKYNKASAACLEGKGYTVK